MTEIKYYPIVDTDTEGLEKQPLFPTSDYKSVQEHHRFWLEEIIPRYFRLCASEPQKREQVSRFRVRCPYCGTALSPISSITEGKRFFLYACNNCSKK